MIRAAVLALLLLGVAAVRNFYDAACCSERDCAPIKAPRVDVPSSAG